MRQFGTLSDRRPRLAPERLAEFARLWAIGLLFLVVSIPVVFALRDVLDLRLWVATLVGGEVGLLASFAVVDRRLAASERPAWQRLLLYHATAAPSFVIWWLVTYTLGLQDNQYVRPAIEGEVVALAWSMLATFGWGWVLQLVRQLVLFFTTGPALEAEEVVEPVAASPASGPTSNPGAASNGVARRFQRLPHHLLPCLVLIVGTAFAFQLTLFFGYRFVGNSDRLNHYIAFILYHTHYLEQGQFSAWSDYIFDGFDSLSLPMSFFTPLYAIPALLHTDDVVAVFGVIAAALFAFTLLEAYFVSYLLTHDRLASLAGACTYGCATYGLLKIEQSDQTYLSVLTAPAFFYLIHTTVKRNWLKRYGLLTLLVAIEFYFAFLQEFSYNVIFFFVYCAYLLLRRNIYPMLALGLAMASGALLSAPRLLVQYATLAVSGRGRSVPTIQDVVDGRTLLRFFSRDIFGASFREDMRFPVPINLHEGDLLHSSVYGALLLVLIIFSFHWVFRIRSNTGRQQSYNATVLILYTVFVFAVMHNTNAYLFIDRLYQNISFQHSRINVSAMLPVALLTALFLAQGRGRLGRTGLWVTAAASALIIAVSAFDFSAHQNRLLSLLQQPPQLYLTCDTCLPFITTGAVLSWDFLRLAALAISFVALVVVALLFGAPGRTVMKTVLAVSIVFQTLWGAAIYLEGPQTRDYNVPYEANDFVIATPDQFLPPTAAELDQMHGLLDNSNYRSVTVCPVSFTLQNCSTMMGMTWGIRLLDGYSSGVPRRLANMPWPFVGGHEMRFQSDDLPWAILSFLNTRQAINMTRELYMNAGLQFPNGVPLVQNPSPYVYPRGYFADTTQAVDLDAAEAAVRSELKTCPPVCDGLLDDRFPIDYVEGPSSVAGSFDNSGQLTWSGGGDRLTFDFPASPNKRFLVVNDTWDPGWAAVVDGHQLPVYATNVMMRGVLVPEGATHVVLVFRSLLYWAWWYTPGLAVFGVIVILAARSYGPRWFSQVRLRRERHATGALMPAEPETAAIV